MRLIQEQSIEPQIFESQTLILPFPQTISHAIALVLDALGRGL